ncbi:Rare lipoprotein A [Erythrobacter dokdonensis DSW-74]|uniref:Endolytic peptidoglycan transglycosylase RlpA n=2 Tax=Erythrobacter TaxID=1041 RepID=A0A1A7BLH0_9SPHN|nr:Rare lipoprotein A [Erythrobacter dokdonensis DSW-74]
MPQWHFGDDDTLPGFAFFNASDLGAQAMRTGIRLDSSGSRGLRAALIASALGMAPLAASTAATPADGAMPVEAGTAAAELSAEIVPLVEAPLADTSDDPGAEQAATTPLGTGTASYYGRKFHGRRTASGETFDMGAMTAAHRTLPFGSLVRVTNPANGRSVTVRINDRGPFSRGRVIDVSRAAAEELGLITRGHAPVALELIGG